MAHKWTAADIPDLSGRTYVVTGATSGLGLQTAIALAAHGGYVIVTGRDPDRLAAARTEVAATASGAEPGSQLLDLADMASVRAAATRLLDENESIDVLVNNAGVMATPRRATKDGFELQIGTNHLGHFAFTGLLLPALPVAAEADTRVVTIASAAHRGGRVVPDDLSFEKRTYSPWTAYAQSKLANLLFAAELDRRARLAGWSLKSVAAHPGWSATNLQFAGPAAAQNRFGRARMSLANAVFGQSAADGALPGLFAATDPAVVSGEYIGPDGPFEVRGHPKRVGRSSAAQDQAVAVRLWEESEALTGVSFGLPAA